MKYPYQQLQPKTIPCPPPKRPNVVRTRAPSHGSQGAACCAFHRRDTAAALHISHTGIHAPSKVASLLKKNLTPMVDALFKDFTEAQKQMRTHELTEPSTDLQLVVSLIIILLVVVTAGTAAARAVVLADDGGADPLDLLVLLLDLLGVGLRVGASSSHRPPWPP